MANRTSDHADRWMHEPVEETLDGARLLTVTVVDRIVRDWWEVLAEVAGIPARRWRRHHPLGPTGDTPVVAMLDGRPAFNGSAWARFASLVPGAVALPTRTAETMSVAREELRPPPGARGLQDLLRARRRVRRMRRAERTLEADLARFRHALQEWLAAATAPGADDAPFATLPTYALAARFEQLLQTSRSWRSPALVDLASGDATARLIRLLVERGHSPEQAAMQAGRMASGGGIALPRYLMDLATVPAVGAPGHEDQLATWFDVFGWHALQELHLEAAPLRARPDLVRTWLQHPVAPAAPVDAVDPPAEDVDLADAVRRARKLTSQREAVARDRADLHAALRALTWTIGEHLAEQGVLERADQIFDQPLTSVLALARGASLTAEVAGPTTVSAGATLAPAQPGAVLHGVGASAGQTVGRVVVLDEPTSAVDLDGAVLVCRITDPGWMPLLQRCAGLVTERGGPLSHAAIVARELGLPAVVAVTDARALLAEAGQVRVDGSAGSVTVDPIG